MGSAETVRLPEEILDTYRERGHEPLWVNDAGLNRRGEELLDVLRSSHEEGLPADRYHVELLDDFVQELGEGEVGVAELELALTSLYFRYAADLTRGHMDSADAEITWLIQREDPPGRELLQRLERGEGPAQLLAELRPSSPQYERLVASLRHYRQVEEAGGWPRLPDDVTLEEGDEGANVVLLRRRIVAEGNPTERELAEPESAPDPERFDPRLREAVEHLQARFALESDGVIGGRTLEELNTPVSQRLRELSINLDRWRWLPRDLGSRHILVNVAGYEMEVVDEGRRVMSMGVVVGEEAWETPVFRDTLDHVIFNPYWNVPASIAESSVIPEVRSDPGYLERNNFEVVEWSGSSPRVVSTEGIDWSEVDAEDFPYTLRQRPGPDNALGRVKFMFPNEHNIYLHDSPAEHLFSEVRRAYSHGCVRVERPFELARLLLELDSDTSLEEVEGELDQNGERRVELRGTVPIYIVYLTAWVEEDGTTRFHHDPYHHDRQIRAVVPG
ncbi:MAG: L,D-transpeptidase family protein [Gemmatimonadota bacterium]